MPSRWIAAATSKDEPMKGKRGMRRIANSMGGRPMNDHDADDMPMEKGKKKAKGIIAAINTPEAY